MQFGQTVYSSWSWCFEMNECVHQSWMSCPDASLQPRYKHSFVVSKSFKLPLQPVKKWIAYILSFSILFCVVVPCSIFDNCEEKEHTEQTSGSDHKKDCNDCSPFSICSSAPGFTFCAVATSLEPVVFYNSPVYSEYCISSPSAYYSSLFQPPRVG